MKPTLKLDKEEIRNKIQEGDGPSGHYVLSVSPEGETRVHWAGDTDGWCRCPDGSFHIRIPSLFAACNGDEFEEAKDLLSERGENVRELIDEGVSLVEYVENTYPAEWEAGKDVETEWLLSTFLAACNGDGDDLNEPFPWGYVLGDDDRERAIRCPFEFEWAN